MILRVFAIYERSMRILVGLVGLWLAQIVVIGVGLRSGFPVPLPAGLPGCIESGGGLFPAVWMAPLVIDTTIFALIIYRSRRYFNNYRGLTSQGVSNPFRVGSSSQGAWGLISRTFRVLIRDSALYFFFIFMVNLSNALIYFSAPPDIKAIGGSFSQLITCTMVSRLVLNLRSLSESSSDEPSQPSYRGDLYRTPPPRNHQETSLWTRTLDNLGGEDYGVTSGSSGTKSSNVEIITTTEISHDIPMERIKESLA
ncbi:hypothetical protein P691DRAFT_710619 [Macrolepiota fuliginosa MF-IS2]|uniref:Uncharacterized protein n=1 Tax=Macrolepiota fuliginosa MF-IS2 TaxID=1400762 RepID=A0A9P5X8F5_9AGAR|nr:hypothetical protein P691DRAFT_710619 [Macrolepiota fuliginosa MF-IS2]